MKKKPDKSDPMLALQAMLDQAKSTGRKEDKDQFFNALYEHYFLLAYSVIVYYKPNFADDIAHEILIKFFMMDIQKLPDFEHGKFERYFLKSVNNHCKTFHRLQHHKNSNLELNPNMHDLRYTSFETSFELENEANYLLSLLSSKQKEIFELHYQGFSYKEIANILEVTEIFVRNNLERGRKKLKKLRYA